VVRETSCRYDVRDEAIGRRTGMGRKLAMEKAVAERDRVIGELTIANRTLTKVQAGEL
jgi:hypothetical protein